VSAVSIDAAGALRIALYILVADGVAALYLGGLLGATGVMVVGAAAAASWWQARLRARLGHVRGLGPAVVALAGLALGAEVVWLATSMLDAFTHLLVFLLLYRLYTRRTLRDARDVAFLAFFMLVAVSPIVLGAVYLLLVAIFLVAGIWTLMLRHVLLEAEEAGRPRQSMTPDTPMGSGATQTGGNGGAVQPPHSLTVLPTHSLTVLPTHRLFGLGRDLAALCLAASVATLAITALLFFTIPRMGQAALPLRAPVGRMVSGFSDRVELGSFGEIELDASPVMRVHLPTWRDEHGSPERLANLRWRGIAFDRYDAGAWRAAQTQQVTFRRHTPGPFPVNRYRGGSVLPQEIYLEPIGTEMVFGAPRMLRVHARSDFMTLDDLGNVSVPVPAARLRYTVDSEMESDPRTARVADAVPPRDARWRERYLQLPPLAPRIRALAEEVTAGSADQWEAAQRLTAHLSTQLRYTRVLQRTTDLDPVEEFLFVQRSGNCEYFAAALAVMLRTLGIPARVVNGFQRGEWNPYGKYFLVRLRDAHSWVEVFIEGAGWLTLDPSPRGGTEPTTVAAPATLYLDALRLRWYRYVINWSLQDQMVAAVAVQRTASSWTAWSLSPPSWRELPRGPLAVVVTALVALAVVMWWRQARGSRTAGPAVPAFYARALRLLARRGLAPAPGETAREFSARAGGQAPGCTAPLARLTAHYERVRFGDARLDAAEIAELDGCLSALEVAR
jgi:transglutaminase-like putative cysteine protease